ncbi:MAG: M60 family metallopeptidase [Rikenellaceae bacterium]|nr:M60 family metallopeptidase [Rikenellaceae bacterium]
MKKSILFLCAVVAALVGCQNNPPEVIPGTTPFVQIERDTLYLGCEGGVENLFVESHNLSWNYTYDDSQEWCFVFDNMDDFGNRVLVVEAEENATDTNRELGVIVTNGEAADELIVVQLANDSKPATTINVSQPVYSFTKEAATITIEVEADGDYEVVIPEECSWLMHDGTAVEGDKCVESFYISANYGDDVRCVTIDFKSLNTSTKVDVRQWGAVDLFVDKEAITLVFIAGRDSVRVDAITEYTAKVTEGDWVTINAEASSDEWIVFDYTENTSKEEQREAVITISADKTTKTVALTQVASNLTDMPEDDNWVDNDVAATVTAVEATSQRSSTYNAERVSDGNVASAWYSAPINDAPQEITLTIDASNLDRIDYLRYHPTSASNSTAWGRWKETDIYVTDADGVETLVASRDFRGGVTTADVSFEPALPNTITKVRIVIKNAVPYVEKGVEYPYVAAAGEIGLYQFSPDGFKNALDYFTDWSLSEIREGVTFEQIRQIQDPFYRSLAEQQFLGTYDGEFRVCEFKAYPLPERDASILRDKPFGLLDNVTGLCVPELNKPMYVFLDEDYGQAIYIRVVDWENNEEAGSTNPNTHTYDYRIQKGRNVVVPKHSGLMYLLVFTDDYAEIPPMKAHFVNATVNGYIKKGVHNEEDIYRIFMNSSKNDEPRFDMISNSAVLNFRKLNYYTMTFKKDIKANAARALELMDLYDTIASTQDHIMGLVKYRPKQGLPTHHRNRMVYDEVETGALGYSGYYHIGLSNKYSQMWVDPDEIWPKNVTTMNANIANKGKTIAHELGHSTQTTMYTWRGQIEVTNNLQCAIFQNYQWGMGAGHTWIRYDNGFNGGMQDYATRWVWDFDSEGNWTERPLTYVESVNAPTYGQTSNSGNLANRCMPLYQLFLFNHIVLGNHDFYPDFYESCRVKDIPFASNSDKSHSAMLYEFVKGISEVSGYDYSDWAKRWRIPGVNNRVRTNHYGQNYFTNTPEEIAEMEEYCSKFKQLPMDPFYIHDENISLYLNPKDVVVGTHTTQKNYNTVTFVCEGWENVVAWLLVDPDKKDDDGNPGRVVAVLKAPANNQFSYVFKESRYVPKDEANGDYSNYKYSNPEQNNRSMKTPTAEYEYTMGLQLYAVDAYGNRYASKSNTK